MSRTEAKLASKSRFQTWREDLQPTLKEMRHSAFLIRHSPLVIIGIILTAAAVFMAIAGPYIAPYDTSQTFEDELCLPARAIFAVNYPCPPNSAHLLGTDNYAYDILTRILYAARLDLGMALVVVLIAAAIGLVLGAVSGYVGGKTDEVIMRVTDVFLAFPGLVLALAIAAILGASFNSIFYALIAVWWPSYVRLMRAQVLSVRENQFVEAARAVGAGTRRIVFKHTIPHILPQMFVYATIDMGGVMLTLAALGFLGLAGDVRVAEWGNMISNSRNYMSKAPWTVLAPGFVLLLTSLGFNLIGDGMRDILDPRLRR